MNLANIGDSLTNIAGLFSERSRQEVQGFKPPFAFFGAGLDREGTRLRREGQDSLADGLAALRAEIEAADNG